MQMLLSKRASRLRTSLGMLVPCSLRCTAAGEQAHWLSLVPRVVYQGRAQTTQTPLAAWRSIYTIDGQCHHNALK